MKLSDQQTIDRLLLVLAKHKEAVILFTELEEYTRAYGTPEQQQRYARLKLLRVLQ